MWVAAEGSPSSVLFAVPTPRMKISTLPSWLATFMPGTTNGEVAQLRADAGHLERVGVERLSERRDVLQILLVALDRHDDFFQHGVVGRLRRRREREEGEESRNSGRALVKSHGCSVTMTTNEDSCGAYRARTFCAGMH